VSGAGVVDPGPAIPISIPGVRDPGYTNPNSVFSVLFCKTKKPRVTAGLKSESLRPTYLAAPGKLTDGAVAPEPEVSAEAAGAGAAAAGMPAGRSRFTTAATSGVMS
jgi:hypothetical protein